MQPKSTWKDQWPSAVLPNFNMHSYHPGDLLKHRFWFYKSGIVPEILHFSYKLPDEAAAASPQTLRSGKLYIMESSSIFKTLYYSSCGTQLEF